MGQWSNYIQLLFVLMVFGASILSWLVKKLREQAKLKHAQSERQRQRVEMLRTGRSEESAPGPAPAQVEQTSRQARLEQIATQRQAQLQQLRRRQQQLKQSRAIAAPSTQARLAPTQAPQPRQTQSRKGGLPGVRTTATATGRGGPASRQAPRARPAARTAPPPGTPTPGAPTQLTPAQFRELQRRRAAQQRKKPAPAEQPQEPAPKRLRRDKPDLATRLAARDRIGAKPVMERHMGLPRPLTQEMIRQAIVINELLKPPVSLRDGYAHDG